MRRGELDMVTTDARRHGRRRHVRPGRRRLSPLFGRRALARPALREDALRQRAARHGVPPRLARHRTRALPGDRRGDGRVHAPRPGAARGRVRLVAGRGHRRRRRADVHVDGRRGRPGGRAAARAVRARPLDRPRRALARDACAVARDPRRAPAARSRRQGDRVLERARSGGARRGGAEARPRRLDRDGPRARRVPARAAFDSAGACTVRYRAGRASGTGYLDDYANVAHGLYELHVATGELRWLEESRRLALLAVELFADEERGGFYMSPADGEQLVARTKDLDDSPIPSGNSMLAYVLLRLARIYGDDELERRAVSVFRLLARRWPATRPSSPGRSVRSTCTSRCRARLQSSAVPTDEVAKAALAGFEPNTVVAFGPSEDVPLLEAKSAGGRQADGLRLRALRLPGARHGSGGASLSW